MIDRSLEQHVKENPHRDALDRLLGLVRPYMPPHEIDLVIKAFQLAFEACGEARGTPTRPISPLEHALAVTTIMARMMHVDAIAITSGLVFEAVDAELLSIEQVERVLGAPTARVVGSMLRLNILERKKQNVATGAMMAIRNMPLASVKKTYD